MVESESMEVTSEQYVEPFPVVLEAAHPGVFLVSQ